LPEEILKGRKIRKRLGSRTGKSFYSETYITGRLIIITPEKWDLEGIAEDSGFAFTIGYELATSDHFPGWNSGSEFKHLRNR